MRTSFDPQMDPVLFTGEFTSLKVVEPVAPPMVGNMTIDPRQPFTIRVEWKLNGFMVPLYLQGSTTDWVVEAYAESLGPGPEIRIAERSVPVGAPDTPKTYSVDFTVPANTLEPYVHGPAGPSGIYRLTVSAFLDSTLPNPGYDIIGFAEGVTIRAALPA